MHPSNGKASSIKKMELFNDIHGDSGGYLHQTISSFTGTVIQSHPPTQRIIANWLLMIFNLPNHGNYRRHGQGKVGQRFSAQFSFNLPISQLLSQANATAES